MQLLSKNDRWRIESGWTCTKANISHLLIVQIRRGDIRCQVTGNRRHSSNLPQGGLEIPTVLIFIAAKNNKGQKAKKLIKDTLNVKVTVSEARSEVHKSPSLPVTKELTVSEAVSDDIEDVINLTKPGLRSRITSSKESKNN